MHRHLIMCRFFNYILVSKTDDIVGFSNTLIIFKNIVSLLKVLLEMSHNPLMLYFREMKDYIFLVRCFNLQTRIWCVFQLFLKALVVLKKGSQLIKYCRKAKPKVRPFRLSLVRFYLLWVMNWIYLHSSSVTRIIRDSTRFINLGQKFECLH